ncbi:EcoAI/FtnUII family type I restriction enzme subunit R [Winogradskyella immobilis]|uniref:DEAD/DEAH box helicase family protein n=1 Tax=Winogradskyella immobilis TaxID=2816852 RepID=A0ABS8ERH0_9FLAO|nr:DEAD/DEAH box helicase family protein [Winogradskyella immobilis]MCC1485616.1 DEAD/DEAH box helicase family protein [Winogradskyella immobilis]MCG0017708.1 DEAD/DEAH box helicase family protein [Winogradskyella immobilis]
MNKKDLSESDIKAKFITPAILNSGWDEQTQLGREIFFTDGRIYVKGKLTARGKRKFADYILFYKPNVPIAIIEAKDNKHSVKSGIQQALGYANTLDIPCVFSSNGDGFYFHDKTATDGIIEKEIALNEFPSPEELWKKYKKYKEIETEEVEEIAKQDYFQDNSGKTPRYYQQIAVNRTIEAVAKEQNRILLVMATGCGKTYTAFHLIWRLWKSGAKKRILFLADRTALIDQTFRKDFAPFKEAMTIIKKKKIDTAYNIYLALYQGLSDSKSEDAYKQFSPDFFDLIIIDECHRGSAKEDSKWREILAYFNNATHVGLTATPKETTEVSNIDYFGEPIYTYSLKQGIDDGFLAPYKVVKVTLDIDAEGWRPPKGFLDKNGEPVEDRIYNRTDFDKNIVVDERRQSVAKKITEFLKGYDRFAKSIVFCIDIEHAEGMRTELANANSDLFSQNNKYVMQITGDNEEGKRELDSFINPSEPYPVIATTSKLMTTGVDAQTCKLIVLDSNIGSMTEFKQIIGRGTRINEEYGKTYFTIMDFRNVTNLFADPDFDGDPVMIKQVNEDDDLSGAEDETTEEIITDILDGEEIEFDEEPDYPEIEGGGEIIEGPRGKIRVNGVPVKIVNERIQYLGNDGKIITESLKNYTKNNVTKQYQTLEKFLNHWNKAEKKEAIIEELEEQGIFFDALKEEVGKDFDPFDLICHLAFEAKPLTRKERANNVKKRNYFTKYGKKAQTIINSLLDKYAEDGLLTIESTEVLKLDPLNKLGTPIELIKAFGGKQQYLSAIKELESELYNSIA